MILKSKTHKSTTIFLLRPQQIGNVLLQMLHPYDINTFAIEHFSK